MNNRNLFLGALLLVGTALAGIGFYIILRPAEVRPADTQTSKNIIPARNSSSPKLVKEVAPGLGWTINPPSYMPCQGLSTPSPSVQINNDATEVKMIVPSSLDRGLAARDEQGREFILKIGDEFELTTTGKIMFSRDHPCVDANGMDGWYDNHVDSPFYENVGGLEFALGNLAENRFFGGTHYQGKAEANGIFIARIIEQPIGYHDDNSGAFTVIVRKVK